MTTTGGPGTDATLGCLLGHGFPMRPLALVEQGPSSLIGLAGLMGQARGIYTFGAHLHWGWAIALDNVASVLTHLWMNVQLF